MQQNEPPTDPSRVQAVGWVKTELFCSELGLFEGTCKPIIFIFDYQDYFLVELHMVLV